MTAKKTGAKKTATTRTRKKSAPQATAERHTIEIARGPGDETGDAMIAAAHRTHHERVARSGHATEANAPAPTADTAGPPQDAPPTGEED